MCSYFISLFDIFLEHGGFRFLLILCPNILERMQSNFAKLQNDFVLALPWCGWFLFDLFSKHFEIMVANFSEYRITWFSIFGGVVWLLLIGVGTYQKYWCRGFSLWIGPVSFKVSSRQTCFSIIHSGSKGLGEIMVQKISHVPTYFCIPRMGLWGLEIQVLGFFLYFKLQGLGFID